jgi:hypothetical protein
MDTAGDCFRIPENIVVQAAARSPQALQLLLGEFGAGMSITDRVVQAAASSVGSDALRLVLHRAKNVSITERMMKAILPPCLGSRRNAWFNKSDAEQKLEFLYTRGKSIPITEDILIAAVSHNMATLLARQYPNEVRRCLTDRVLLATAASTHGITTLKLYERRFGCHITDMLRLVYRLGAAVRDKHLWALRRLLEQGVTPDTADCDSKTPLHYAAFGHRESIVEALLQTDSVNVNAINLEGETPLLEAVRTGDSTIVRLLLDKGADPNIVDFRGQTAYSIAEERMYLRIMNTLEEFGADTGLASCEVGLELCYEGERLRDET